MPALHHVLEIVLHVVAQVVESELVVRSIGDVGRVGLPAFVGVQPVHDDADVQSKELVNSAHPFRVAAGEIVVDGDDVDALAGKRVQVHGERGNERLAFAGPHFGNRALVQHHPADELHVEMPLAERSLCGLAHRRESLRENVVEISPVSDLLAEDVGPGSEFGITQCRDLWLKSVDFCHERLIALEAAIVGRSKDHTAHIAQAQHEVPSCQQKDRRLTSLLSPRNPAGTNLRPAALPHTHAVRQWTAGRATDKNGPKLCQRWRMGRRPVPTPSTDPTKEF